MSTLPKYCGHNDCKLEANVYGQKDPVSNVFTEARHTDLVLAEIWQDIKWRTSAVIKKAITTHEKHP